MLENSIVIDYQGSIKYETIGELIHSFKHQVPVIGIPTGIYKRILLVMIESLENIMKHSELPLESEDKELLPVLMIRKKNDHYSIQCSNLLSIKNTEALKTKLDYLNSLSTQALKELYKNTITDGLFTKAGGAGLGLIEILKVSGNPITYEFTPVNKEYVRYNQQITIGSGDRSRPVTK